MANFYKQLVKNVHPHERMQHHRKSDSGYAGPICGTVRLQQNNARNKEHRIGSCL